MKKPLYIVITVVLVVGLAVAVYFYWQGGKKLTPEETALKSAGDAAQALTEGISQGLLPAMDLNTNPLETAPDVNPVTKTNPLSGIKTNPFGE